jgi:phosphate transport system permease protein
VGVELRAIILTKRIMFNYRSLRKISWTKIVLLVMAIIPLLILIAIVVNLVVSSNTALTQVGIKQLFSPQFSGIFTTGQHLYGLLPAIWGTIEVVFISMLIALPVSLALAIICTEFSIGILSTLVRAVVGALSGIPPVIYALMSSVISALFIIPKFCALGIPKDQLPPPGLTWWTQSMLPYDMSTLLGGVLLAALIIPFMTPLMDDAIRNIPRNLKEASFAMGATRWHTLMEVTLPAALPGISAATTLGILKAMGDVIIVSWVIGFESGLPSPLIDILEKTAPLTSTAAGLAGGFTRSGSHGPIEMSVASFSGLLLLLMAFIILGASAYLQKILKSRYSK